MPTKLEIPTESGLEFLTRLRRIQNEQHEQALATLRRLANPSSEDTVSDADLVDAAFCFASQTDLANPVVPIMSYLIERFMVLANIEETPQGLKRDYLRERG